MDAGHMTLRFVSGELRGREMTSLRAVIVNSCWPLTVPPPTSKSPSGLYPGKKNLHKSRKATGDNSGIIFLFYQDYFSIGLGIQSWDLILKFNYPRLSSIMYITHRSVTFMGISPRQLTSYIPNCCNNFSEDSEIWIFPAMKNTQKRVNNNYSSLNTVYMYINYLNCTPQKWCLAKSPTLLPTMYCNWIIHFWWLPIICPSVYWLRINWH